MTEHDIARENPEQTVLYDVGDDGVATITLNRPERKNAWTPVMERRFYAVIAEADHDSRVRVAVLTGAGSAFCPGVDIQRLDSIAGAPMDLAGRSVPSRTHSFRKPLIAAINGPCAGLGLVQALLCDVRFMARGARLSTAFARRGLPAEYGASWLIPRIVGIERALDLMLTGRVVDADEALRIGLVAYVVEPDELLTSARTYAADIAANCSPTSLALIKHQTLTDLDAGFERAMHNAYRTMAYTATSADFREGVDSYVQKRPPAFSPLADDFDPAAITGAAMPAAHHEAQQAGKH
ncbi:MAG TPA: enoyl-CoA hydratase-related protein [Mycobacteriales bacterium]|nr:enoyl-CoA hydratase-related protein [Mycobacteriales bacterium]